MEDWTKWSDEQVFGGASESPGSQAAYWRETEIKRRLYLLDRDALAATLAATEEQRATTKMQGVALAAAVISLIAVFVG